MGQATEFLRKVANDWGVVITAYTKRVVLTPDQVKSGTYRYYLHLENEKPIGRPAADLVIYEEEIPYRPAHTFRVGPPLSP